MFSYKNFSDTEMSYELSADFEKRKKNAAKVMDILEPIPKSENRIFENTHYDSDGSSELADPFSDDEEDLITIAIKSKVLYLLINFQMKLKTF